jgi:hypothetical protein
MGTKKLLKKKTCSYYRITWKNKVISTQLCSNSLQRNYLKTKQTKNKLVEQTNPFDLRFSVTQRKTTAQAMGFLFPLHSDTQVSPLWGKRKHILRVMSYFSWMLWFECAPSKIHVEI